MQSFDEALTKRLSQIRQDGLYKTERLIGSHQGAHVTLQAPDGDRDVINLCANNYLGLADNPELIRAATEALQSDGFGMASVRFICGTNDLHRQMERALAAFLEKDDAILYAACFDANGGLFEALLSDEDAIVSDSLNHASIIDGIRLSKAKRYRYQNNDLGDLEAQLKAARSEGARFVMIATDGVFSMDGYYADLEGIADLADQYDAIVMVDDCHATGFVGEKGRGTPWRAGVSEKIDILTGTLGKAMGGAIGGYIAASQPIIDMLRQVSRPYLFSNSLPPAIAAAGLEAIRLVEAADDLRQRLFDNAEYWRSGLEAAGFTVLPGSHPIIPVMIGDADLSQRMANRLFDLGVFVTGFFYPVVPKGKARIRTQMNAALTRKDLDQALEAFKVAGRAEGIIA